ncbi:MAG: SprT family zinc-dependent metalloprotease [Caldimonas sp.]
MQGLRRRIVDAFQRGLFDEPARVPAAKPPKATDSPPRLPGAAHATRSARLGEVTVDYLLRRSRRRTIGFVIGDEGLAVIAPARVSLRDIDAAVQDKGRWILAKLGEQRELQRRRDAARIVWVDGAAVEYLGAPLVIRLGAGSQGAVLDAVPGPPVLRLDLPPGADEARVRDATQSWLQREARRVFAERSALFAERLGVRVTRLSLSSAATRWGSASADGGIRLNWRLIHFALPTIDYVVAHELAHLREMNHGPRFWAIVRSAVPAYEDERRRLRDAARQVPG